MASSYITKNDLSQYSKVVLGLLSERDTKMDQNESDIQSLYLAISSLEAKGLVYKGEETSYVPTSPEDQDLYWFNIPASGTNPAMYGYYFWSDSDNEWRKLSGDSTVIDIATDAEMLSVVFNITT